MTSTDYPIFTGGQKLTAAELNQGVSFLDARDHDLGRAIGFGIACGLVGSITDATVSISPGIAVDQSGAAIVVRTPRSVSIADVPSNHKFDFIDDSFPGLTVLLCLHDSQLQRDDCADLSGDDCTGTSDTRRRDAELWVVKGRLIDEYDAFAMEPLLQENVIGISATGRYQGDPTSLRSRITQRLIRAGGVATRTIAQLTQISFPASDLAGVKAYKAMFINEVLFRTLGLLRCKALSKVACVRDDISAVVLGYIEKSPSSWEWSGEYRHEWEPPTGVSRALQGGSSASPCAHWIGQLTAWSGTYRPPEPPARPDPTPRGTPQVTECSKFAAARGMCLDVSMPVGGIPAKNFREIADALRELPPVRYPDPRSPITPDPRRVLDPVINARDVYGTSPIETFGQGRWVLGEILGHTDTVAMRALTDAFDDSGLTLRADTISMENAAKLADFEITSIVAPSDHVYLVLDANNVVQATGRIPVSHEIAKIGTALPAAAAAAENALALTSTLSEQQTELSQSVTTLTKGVAEVESFRSDLMQWKGTVEQTISSIDQSIQGKVTSLMIDHLSTVQQRIATIEGSVNVLSRAGGIPSGGTLANAGRAMDRSTATALVEVVESFNQALSEVAPKSDARLFERYRGDAARASGKLEAVMDSDDPRQFNSAVLGVLDTLRTATKSAGVSKEIATQLDMQYRIVRDMLR